MNDMKTKNTISSILLLLIGGIGITLTGINWNIGLAAWLAPVFLLRYTRNAKWFQFLIFFLILCISGMISQTGNNLFHIPAVNIFNGITFGILSSIAYLTDRILYKKGKQFFYTLVFPSAIISVEYFVSFAIGTWGSLAHTQHGFTPLLQISSVTGIYGISFLITWFGSVANWIIENKTNRKSGYRSALIYIGILCTVLGFGILRLKFQIPKGETVKVAVVLSNTDLHSFSEKEKDLLNELAINYSTVVPPRVFSTSETIDTIIQRTQTAISNGAKIIVWNEAALFLNQQQKSEVLSKIRVLSRQKKTYILISFLEKIESSEQKPFNNQNLMVSPEGDIVWEYMKSFLHPYAEAPIINKGDFQIPVTESKYGRVGSVICSDLDMHNYIKQTGEKGVDILLVPAFDWEGITPLHSHMAELTAIQNGFSLVRANGKGISIVSNYYGSPMAKTNTFNSGNKILYAEIPTSSPNTLYSKLGDIIVFLSILFIVFTIVLKIRSRS